MGLFTEQSNYLILGKKGCLPKGTLVRTVNGTVPIEKAKTVLSYNMKNNCIEPKRAVVYKAGMKQVIKIYSSRGVLECSPEHKWIVIRDKKIVEVRAKDLNTTDYLLLVK